ncbi:MAG: septal ring lytic transglycosylase RlpA family protein [Myxococcales bacterium]|nr:septal ring lytic transglycosylase RlpA family protein [Myxococcales bacterium]
MSTGTTFASPSRADPLAPDRRPVTFLLAAALAAPDLWVTSWYGERFRGRPTASGEIFDPDGFTAAHRTLPFGTRLRVTNPTNGNTVEVRVNDRGPFVPGRQLDVSEAAAEALDIVDVGVKGLEVEVLETRGV